MIRGGRIPALAVALLAGVAGVASAQESGMMSQVPPVEGDVNGRAMDARERRMLARICWERGEPRGADWMADRDPAFRREVFARFVQQSTDTGWRWLPAESVRNGDLRADRGYTDRVLEVHALEAGDRAWARLEVAGPLREGTVRLEWTLPPERICMLEELELEAAAEVVEGSPGDASIGFLMPLSQELMAETGQEVRACSPGASITVDALTGPERDAGECRRGLLHLQQGASWAVWVRLPESFWVVYPYTPAR